MDRTMDLPPGVVLASPDEPPPATLPMMSTPSQEGPLIDPALGIDQTAPEIDQIFGPMQASMPLNTQAPSEPSPVTESPMTTLPADLPDALFSDSAPALWLPPAPEAEIISPIEAPSESSTWENLAPPDPMMDMTPPAEFVPTLSSPPAEATPMPMAQPMEQPITIAPVEAANNTHLTDALNEAAMVAPPSLDSAADLAPPAAEPASIPQAEAMYYQPESTYMPADANFDPDPVPLDEMAPSMEMPDISMATMNDTADFLPPTMDDTSAFDYIPPLESIPNESMNPHAASYEAPMESTENSYSQEEPASASPGNDSFFVSTSFDAMDGFGQVNGNAGLFTPEDIQQAPPAQQDDLYLPPDADFGSLQLEASDSVEAGQAYVPDEAYAEDDYSTGEYSVGEYLSDETVMMDTLNDEEGEYSLDDMAIVEDVGDSASYDLGHYDDPDAPLEAFVLGSDEPEPILSLDLETSQASMEDEELVASFSAEEPPMPEPVQHMPAIMPEPQPHPMSAALAEVSQPEPPKPISAAPIPPRANPIQESAFRKSSTSHTPYSDSIADALQTFEQEVLLRDTRFLKQSINNLVDRYFAQSEPENEW